VRIEPVGLTLTVETLSGQAHSAWDWTRHVGDREFCDLAHKSKLPHASQRVGAEPDCEWYWRPTDFAVWGAAVEHFQNRDRFVCLLNLLERDPHLWLRESW
jgi:hypothetical protein